MVRKSILNIYKSRLWMLCS